MTVFDSQPILSEADVLLEIAKKELCRPDEDVVHYMVCMNAFKAIEKYLAGFLINKGVRIHNSTSVDDLLSQCSAIDPIFTTLNIDPLTRAGDPQNLWMNIQTAKELVQLAEETKNRVEST